MAQLNSLLVTGNSRFLNPINGNARNGIYYVKGTQTAATGSWTGVIPVPALYDGLTIMYYLPYAGSGNATLNLTLSDGTTTGAKNCYYNGWDRLTTHYNSGQNVVMTYHPAGSISVNGTATSDDRWVVTADYNSDYILPYTWTGGGTADKYISGGYLYTDLTCQWFMFNLIYANTYAGALRLNVNGNGAKPLYINGTVSSSSNYTMPRGTYLTYYDGTNYYVRTDGKITASITGDAATVGGHTVAKDVPSNAVFTDNNTTYTFSGGNDGFSVTPSGGSAQYVGVATYRLRNTDTRSDNQLPSWYMTNYGRSIVEEFKGCSTIGVNSVMTGIYCTLTTFVPWNDNSGGRPVQIALSDSGVRAQRVATADDTWGSWIALPNQNTNTTYTFANGTNGFTVTPSGGSAQTVTVTPSIANNVTGSGTSGYIAKFNGGNTITNGPALGSSTTTFLRNDGQWAVPPTASGGNKIFIVEPTPPYSVGDLWVVDDNNISVCATARASGSFDDDDWGSAVDAIDADTLQTAIESAISDTITVVTGAGVDGGNVMWRLNNNVPYELLITDTPTNITSNSAKIYRWDANGLRFSSTGYNGTYSTLINTSGQIPAQYLTGNLNAGVVAIQNFTAAMVHGGVLTRGKANNQDGTIEVYDANGTLIAEVSNLGLKIYGQGSGADRPYYLINTSGFIGYTKVNGTWTQTVKVAFDEFRMVKGYVGEELNIGNMIKIVPMTTSTNSGIAFTAVT